MQVPIVFCADANYGRYLPVAVQSIIENSSAAHEYHIIIFDCGIREADLAVLERQLVAYSNFSLKIYQISVFLEKYKKEFYTRKKQYISTAAYGRLLIPDLCKGYDKIIYADIDMIFELDISELMAVDLKDNYIAAVSDIETPKWLLSAFPPGRYVNSGLLVFNCPAWQQNGLTKRAIELLAEMRLKKHDQDAINLICKGKIAYLEKRWNCINRASAPDNAVLHFAGAKPWYCFSVFKADIWWHYARSVETYKDLFEAAKTNRAHLNMYKGDIFYRFCGFPFIRVRISEKSKKYYLFALRSFHFAEVRNYLDKSTLSYYFCHIRLFSRHY